jgi:hypothetical protein
LLAHLVAQDIDHVFVAIGSREDDNTEFHGVNIAIKRKPALRPASSNIVVFKH